MKIFYEILDQTRSGSSGIEKSHGTRLSYQDVDETMRKPHSKKPTTDETKLPEAFDVNKNLYFILFYKIFFLSHQKLRQVYSSWNEYSI